MSSTGETIEAGAPLRSVPRERFWYPYLLIAPSMIMLTVVSLIPFLYTIYLSFHAAKFGRVTDFIGFANYAQLLTDARFWNSMGVAAVFVGIAVPIEFMLGLIGALVLNQNVRPSSSASCGRSCWPAPGASSPTTCWSAST
jgi:multiple sugar transport system permease protein